MMGEMGNASLDGADGVDEAMIPSPYLPYLPYYPQNSTSISEINFLLEVVRFGNKSKLHWKGVYLVYISFQGNEHGAKIGAYHKKDFVVRRVPSATLGKNATDG